MRYQSQETKNYNAGGSEINDTGQGGKGDAGEALKDRQKRGRGTRDYREGLPY